MANRAQDHEDVWTDPELVATLVRRAVCCPCPYPARIAIAYAPGPAGKSRADALRGQIRASRHDIPVILDHGPSDLHSAARPHACAVFDVETEAVL